MPIDLIRLIGVQGILIVISAAFIYRSFDYLAVKSFVYGSLVVVIGAILLAWRYKQGLTLKESGLILRQAYKAAIERYVWAIFLLGMGLKLLELSPFWLLAGFVMGQAVWLLAPIWMRLRTKNDN